jgi:hypothetical protein
MGEAKQCKAARASANGSSVDERTWVRRSQMQGYQLLLKIEGAPRLAMFELRDGRY